MTDLSSFAVAKRWPPAHPDRIQLYSLPTPNGVKASIMLEEVGLPYEAHAIDLAQGQSKEPAFVDLNPNGRIPAIIDPNGPGGKAIGLWESGAILLYLAEKTKKFIPKDPAKRYEVLAWLFFQMSGVGPMFGQFGFFNRTQAQAGQENPALTRFAAESMRLLTILDKRLAEQEWIVGDYSIADIATLGWVRALRLNYKSDLVNLSDYSHVERWLDRALERPAVKRGLIVPKRP